MIHLASALIVRDESVLLVASHYANHDAPIWNLPGGRQQRGELLVETAAREVFEETGLAASVGALAYVSESYDGDVQFLNATFVTTVSGELNAELPRDDHVTAVAWIPLGELARYVTIAVVREPLLAYVNGELPSRYAGYHEAGVTIIWPDGSS